MDDHPRSVPAPRSLVGTLHCAPDGSILSTDEALAALLGWDGPQAMLAQMLAVEQLYADPQEGRRLRGRLPDALESRGTRWLTRGGESVGVRTTLRRLPALPAEGTVLEVAVERVADGGESRIETRAHEGGTAAPLPLSAVLGRARPLLAELLPPGVGLRVSGEETNALTPDPERLAEVLVLLAAALSPGIADGSELLVRLVPGSGAPASSIGSGQMPCPGLAVELVWEGTPAPGPEENTLVRSVLARLRRMEGSLEIPAGSPGRRKVRLFLPTVRHDRGAQSSERMR